MLETQYYQIKGEILELASRFQNGDEEAQDQLRKQADFFPISRSPSNPVGFQIMGAPFEKATLLDLGDLYQSRTKHHLARPSL